MQLDLGQIFTPYNIVQRMIGLKQNQGKVLEPSCGDGAFLKYLPDATGIEIDQIVCPNNALNIDFFDYSMEYKFDCVIGNPPYVAYKAISDSTKKKLNKFDNRTNLYVHFIDKCLDHLNNHGELIFITPRDFLKLTSAYELNERLYKEGSFTHFFDLGDAKVFPDATPNCAIWRWQKGLADKTTETENGPKRFNYVNGQIFFSNNTYSIPFKDLFFVKVGAVSGADKVFAHPEGLDYVFSETLKTGKTRKMLSGLHPHLETCKEALMRRRIKLFDESNWYCWGRDYFQSDLPRVYVNCKTRQPLPFFTHPCNRYEGSVMAVFSPKIDVEEAKNRLNQVNWAELGFKVGGRFVFSQRSLENISLPEDLFNHP